MNCRRTCHPQRATAAFTLIELLVVVAVIALLMSILLPALSSAREQAKSVLCASRQREIGTLEFMYANENGQTIPSFDSDGNGVNEKTWCKWLYDAGYLRYQKLDLLICPSYPPNSFDNSSPSAFATSKYFTYGMLRDSIAGVTVRAPANKNAWEYIYFKLNNMDYNPSRLPLLADTHASSKQVAYFFRNSASNNYVVHRRHTKSAKANILFGDGHVESCGYGETVAYGIAKSLQ